MWFYNCSCDKLALGQALLQVLHFYPVSGIAPVLLLTLYSSTTSAIKSQQLRVLQSKNFHIIIILPCYRKCHIVSFFFTFAYLFFFRMTEFFGIPYPPSHTNLVQMMVTLKVNNVFILNIYVVFLGRNFTNCADGRH